MAKKRAEIQKAYREQKKAKEGSAYLDNEVKRVQKYYRRTVNLSKTELEKRREKKDDEEGHMKNLPLRTADCWLK